MELGQLKTQIMTMFMMKSASQNKEKNGHDEIFVILYSMALMSFVEFIFKHLPTIGQAIKTYMMKRLEKKVDWVPMIESKKTEDISSVTLVRVYESQQQGAPPKQTDNVYTEKVDAILEYICRLDSAKHVKIDTRCALNNTEEIKLTPLIKARVKTIGSGESSSIEIAIYSGTLKVSELRAWIDDVHANYMYERANKLGNKTYYFNEVPIEPHKQVNIGEKDANGRQEKTYSYRWDAALKHLQFQMNEFKTSKSFSNVYGDHVTELKERLDLFLKHPEWYMERGIPHSLGIMLHGVPGAGKTSTIKAIAKDTNRHIFNLSLREYTSQSQLTNLFFNETVQIFSSENQKISYKIPLNRRVYVIEDIDCLTNVVLDRKLYPREEQPDGDAVTLSFLLNLLDGVLETPGRILVITSNYPERLDKAFIRPGRIDVKIKFDYAQRQFIQNMINSFYSTNMPLDDIPDDLDGVFTPAEVMESLCTHFKSPTNALEHMKQKRQYVLDSRNALTNSLLVSDSELSSLRDTNSESSDISQNEYDDGEKGTSIEMLEAQKYAEEYGQDATEFMKQIPMDKGIILEKQIIDASRILSEMEVVRPMLAPELR